MAVAEKLAAKAVIALIIYVLVPYLSYRYRQTFFFRELAKQSLDLPNLTKAQVGRWGLRFLKFTFLIGLAWYLIIEAALAKLITPEILGDYLIVLGGFLFVASGFFTFYFLANWLLKSN